MEIIAVYIGREFYTQSGSRMGDMMLVDGTRFCLGDIGSELGKGNTVIVRPATNNELGRAHKILRDMKKRRKLTTLG